MKISFLMAVAILSLLSSSFTVPVKTSAGEMCCDCCSGGLCACAQCTCCDCATCPSCSE